MEPRPRREAPAAVQRARSSGRSGCAPARRCGAGRRTRPCARRAREERRDLLAVGEVGGQLVHVVVRPPRFQLALANARTRAPRTAPAPHWASTARATTVRPPSWPCRAWRRRRAAAQNQPLPAQPPVLQSAPASGARIAEALEDRVDRWSGLDLRHSVAGLGSAQRLGWRGRWSGCCRKPIRSSRVEGDEPVTIRAAVARIPELVGNWWTPPNRRTMFSGLVDRPGTGWPPSCGRSP